MQRILAKHKRIGIEKCGVCATFDTTPSCLPGMLKIDNAISGRWNRIEGSEQLLQYNRWTQMLGV